MNRRNNKNKNFWQKIRFKYKLIILNESTLEDIFTIRISQLTAFLAGLLLAVLFVFFVVFLILATPLRNYLPGYLNAELRTELVENRMRLDSLTEQNLRRSIYLDNIRAILKGEVVYDSVAPMDSLVIIPPDSLPTKSKREQQYVARFAEEEKYNLTILTQNAPAEGLIFYPPVKGVIAKGFDPANNITGIEILCARNASVTTPLEGTVIFTGYTVNDGYVMQIQHNDGYISVFKNLHQPLKQVNQRVAGGNLIGMMAKGDATEAQPKLYYELWHKGIALNPENYINF